MHLLTKTHAGGSLETVQPGWTVELMSIGSQAKFDMYWHICVIH